MQTRNETNINFKKKLTHFFNISYFVGIRHISGQKFLLGKLHLARYLPTLDPGLCSSIHNEKEKDNF